MRRITPSLVLSVLALVLATTAGATAASSLITGKQIKNSSITGTDIRDGSLKSADIASAAIGPSKLSDGLLLQIQNPKPGPTGPQGPAGPAGPAGVASVTRIDGPATSQGAFGSGNEVQSSTATCPPGAVVTGGGFAASGIDDIVEYTRAGVSTYSVIAVNEFSQSSSIQAQAMCASGNGVVAASVRRGGTPPSVRAKVRAIQAAVNARTSCKRATIGGQSRCIARGQYCSRKYQSDYRRYGFSCSAVDARGRYHLR